MNTTPLLFTGCYHHVSHEMFALADLNGIMEWTIFPFRTDAAKEAMAIAGDADLKRNLGL